MKNNTSIHLKTNKISLNNIFTIINKTPTILNNKTIKKIHQTHQQINNIITQKTPIYNMNTKFKHLTNIHIPIKQLTKLQKNLIISHTTNINLPIPITIIQTIIFLQITTFTQNLSKPQLKTIHTLLTLLKKKILPIIP